MEHTAHNRPAAGLFQRRRLRCVGVGLGHVERLVAERRGGDAPRRRAAALPRALLLRGRRGGLDQLGAAHARRRRGICGGRLCIALGAARGRERQPLCRQRDRLHRRRPGLRRLRGRGDPRPLRRSGRRVLRPLRRRAARARARARRRLRTAALDRGARLRRCARARRGGRGAQRRARRVSRKDGAHDGAPAALLLQRVDAAAADDDAHRARAARGRARGRRARSGRQRVAVLVRGLGDRGAHGPGQ